MLRPVKSLQSHLDGRSIHRCFHRFQIWLGSSLQQQLRLPSQMKQINKETRTTTWNLPGPSASGTWDCINIVITSRTPSPSSVEANTDITHNQRQTTLKVFLSPPALRIRIWWLLLPYNWRDTDLKKQSPARQHLLIVWLQSSQIVSADSAR